MWYPALNTISTQGKAESEGSTHLNPTRLVPSHCIIDRLIVDNVGVEK